MNPDLEFFLEDVFCDLKPTSGQIGRVVVEPDYETIQAESDRGVLREQLIELIRERLASAADFEKQNSLELEVSQKLQPLAKYVRTVTLHKDCVPGAWVEVTPPGNWI